MYPIILASMLTTMHADSTLQPPVGVPRGRAPTHIIGYIGFDTATRVLNLLGRNGIPSTADGPFVYHEVKVPPRHAARARELLRMDALQGSYWLQLNNDR